MVIKILRSHDGDTDTMQFQSGLPICWPPSEENLVTSHQKAGQKHHLQGIIRYALHFYKREVGHRHIVLLFPPPLELIMGVNPALIPVNST